MGGSLRTLPEYPWDRLEPYRAIAAAHPAGVVDLSIGSPVDPTPQVVRDALATATDAHAYPSTAGTPELRDAICAWYRTRRGVELSSDAVLPTVGSKELVAMLPFFLGLGAGDTVVFPRVAYPSYEMGAALVGATPCPADDPADWPESTRLVWINSPGNPTGSVLDVAALRARVTRARELGAVIVGDECYAEFGWDAPWDSAPIPSILDPRVVGDESAEHRHRGVLGIYSLSKQSNLAGYRAAFLAGDPDLVAQLLTVRKHAGMIVPRPVQAAMVAALHDTEHVNRQRERYRSRRSRLLPALRDAGFEIVSSEAGLYVWITRHEPCWDTIAWFAERGIIAGPGEFYGAAAERCVRVALTASDAAIDAAVERLRSGPPAAHRSHRW